MHRGAPTGLSIPSVSFENRGSADQLVEHLITVHGRRRIAFLRGPDGNQDLLEREAGYRAALARHGIAFDPALVDQASFDPHGGTAAANRLLDAGVSFDAVFAGDDEAAAGVLFALSQRSVSVPQEVAIVGFDDNVMAPLLPVPLTTVYAPGEQAGFEAARLLIRQIQDGIAQEPVVLQTHVVIRRSCGCPEREATPA